MSGAIITGVKRFEIHDGDGIRTTLFLKGCPLGCLWCHNPENMAFRPQLMFFSDRCLGCGLCTKLCKNHSFSQGIHAIDWGNCAACGVCAENCPAGALEISGKAVEPEEILPILLEDRMFFESSGGGVTISGGEPLARWEFTLELLKLLKKNGVHTAVDTCLFSPAQVLDQVAPYADQFLVDIKAMDPEVHRRCTGVSNEQILENIRFLDRLGAYMEIRVPYIPGHNDGEMGAIAAFISSLERRPKVRLLPYHDYGDAKYHRLGRIPNPIPQPREEDIRAAMDIFRIHGLTVTNGAGD